VIIRFIIILALAAVLALGVAWVADRPGEISVTWLGWHIETSIMVAAGALAIIVALLMFLWSVARTILRSPDLVARFVSVRRSARGDRAVSRGLIAVGLRSAQYAAEAGRLLNAQTAQLSETARGADSRSALWRDATTQAARPARLFIEAPARGYFRRALRRRSGAISARLRAGRAAPPCASSGGTALVCSISIIKTNLDNGL
jgi:HemY protein